MSVQQDINRLLVSFREFENNARALDRDMKAYLQPQIDALNERISMTQKIADQRINSVADGVREALARLDEIEKAIVSLNNRISAVEHELETGRVDHDRNG